MYNQYHEQMKKILSPQQYEKMMKQQFSLRQRRGRNPQPQQKIAEPIVHLKKASKKTKSPQTNHQKEKISLLQFSTTIFFKQDEELNYVKQHKQALQIMLSTVLSYKGIVQVASMSQWQQVWKVCKQRSQHFRLMDESQLFKIYMNYIIQYEFYLKGETLNLKSNVQITKTLSRPLYIHGRLKQIMKNAVKGIDMYKNQIVVFPKGVQELQVQYSDINLQLIARQCGDQKIEVRIQRPLDYGFNPYKMSNIPYKLTISEYCAYQKNVDNEQYKTKHFGQLLQKNKVFFGVNFQPSNLGIFSQLWKHFEGNFLGYRQQFDLLSYLDSDIPGCSSPQFYLKVQGCWTGGHQENVNMCAVNVNHGPDPSQWYTMPYSQVQELRATLFEKFQIDLYKDEGLWFQKINWFIENGFPVKRIVQNKGDIVISGPGTLHWVRSYGIALQSAWNVFPKTLQSINASKHRHHENQLLRLEKSGTIPLRSLFVKYLDHELGTMDDRILESVLQQVTIWHGQDQGHRISLQQVEGGYYCSKNSVQYSKLSDLQALCCKCKHEIFNYYVLNWQQDGILCMKCFKKAKNKPEPISFVLHSRYPIQDLEILLDNALLRKYLSKSDFKTSLCFWPHIGPVKCEKKDSGQKNRSRCARCIRNCTQKDNGLKDYVLKNARTTGEEQPIKKVFILNQINPSPEEGEVDFNANKEVYEDIDDKDFYTSIRQDGTRDHIEKDQQRRSNLGDHCQKYIKRDELDQNTEKSRYEKHQSQNQSKINSWHQNNSNYERKRDDQSYKAKPQREDILKREHKPIKQYNNHSSEKGRLGEYQKSEKDYSNRKSERQRDSHRSQKQHDNYKSQRQSKPNRDYKKSEKNQQWQGRDRSSRYKKDNLNIEYTSSSRYSEKDKRQNETKKVDETIDY